tara:strand:- start:31226 stop:31465 length:240 start_codon:yes stop_codon:yes gene_type:complete
LQKLELCKAGAFPAFLFLRVAVFGFLATGQSHLKQIPHFTFKAVYYPVPRRLSLRVKQLRNSSFPFRARVKEKNFDRMV